jgi:hypothetical protein
VGPCHCAGVGSSLVRRLVPAGPVEGVIADADLECSFFVYHARVVWGHYSGAKAMRHGKWMGRVVREIVDSRSPDMPEVMAAIRPRRISREVQERC